MSNEMDVENSETMEPTCTCSGATGVVATTDVEDCPFHTDPDVEPEEDPEMERWRLRGVL